MTEEAQTTQPAPRRRGRGPAKEKQQLNARLAEIGCDTTEAAAMLAMDQVPCRKCDDHGEVSAYKLLIFTNSLNIQMLAAVKDVKETFPCPWCFQTKFEFVDHNVRRLAIQMLMDRQVPKLSSITINDKVARPLVIRAHAIDDVQEQARVRGAMAILSNLENSPDEEAQPIIASLRNALSHIGESIAE